MNIIQRCRTFVDKLRELARCSAWEWRTCPRCGSTYTIKNGGYWRQPWTLSGRQKVRIQRHKCSACGRTYSEEQAWLVRGSWYARAVHRQAVDWWVHGRSSLRRITEMLRSEMGRQERWLSWHVWEEAVSGQERCGLGASTLHRWLDGAGKRAEAHVADQLEGVACSGQMGSDGLWARLRGGAKSVVLSLVDTVSGVVWGIVVAAEEESQAGWRKLFEQAKRVGLASEAVNGLVSDGAQGLLSYLRGDAGVGAPPALRLALLAKLGGRPGQGGSQGRGRAGRRRGQAQRVGAAQGTDDLAACGAGCSTA